MTNSNYNNDFKNEYDFETKLIKKLLENGWRNNINHEIGIKDELNNATIEDLELNWLKILNHMNREKLKGQPITKDELKTLINSINNYENISSINTNMIKKNTWGVLRRGEEQINLSLINKFQFNDDGGKNYFQIARQFRTKDQKDDDKRPDLLLLINGMPLIHIELKRDDKSIDRATNNIENYDLHNRSIYSGILKLVHIVIAMTPYSMKYALRNKELNFQKWYNKNEHKEINYWEDVVRDFLSIPKSLELICHYTMADKNELKMLRSYQYYAVKKILEKIKKSNLSEADCDKPIKGGYIWHSTGSGKTFTSFKASSLIIDYNLADIVIFVADRIELVDQTYEEFGIYIDKKEDIEETSSAKDLSKHIKSKEQKIIVTSINKLSKQSETYKHIIDKKRIVLIFDEAHRSTSSEMMKDIKKLFNKRTIIFGFTGTPIFDNNELTTEDIFGEQLDRYTMGDSIIHDQVLKFAFKYLIFEKLYKWAFKCNEKNNNEYCLERLNSFNSIVDFKNDFKNEQNSISYKVQSIIEEFTEKSNNLNKLIKLEKEIEYIYDSDLFKNLVVEDILSDYSNQETPYSSLLATSNIQDAMKYFNIFENHIENSENEKIKNFKFTVLFTKTENNEESPQKIEVHEEFFEKLYSKYEADFDQKIYEYSEFKKDISTRLKRKKEGKVLDLLIVVNQMLTGFDSKYIQTVYFDKTPKSYELIQNVSRTNRKLLHSNKKYGRSFFYRKPNHMKQEVQESFKKYSFQNLEEISAKKLEEHFPDINKNFQEISNLLTDLNLKWFERIPQNFEYEDVEKIKKIKKLLRHLLSLASKMRNVSLLGFDWEIHGKNIEFDSKIEKTIDPKIRDINRILAQLPSEKDEYEFDPDVNIFYDSLEYINTNARTEEYDKEFFIKLEKELKNATKDQVDEILSYTSSPDNELIKEWYDKHRQGKYDKSLQEYVRERKKLSINKLVNEISNKFLISEEKILEFITEIYIEPDDIEKNNNFDRLWSFTELKGPQRLELKDELKKQIKNLKEKYRG